MKRQIIIECRNKEKTYVKLDMAGYYHDFIHSIPDKPTGQEDRFRNGVALIIWGAFYLEAAINESCMKILEDSTCGIIKNADVIWPFIEKATTERKFEFIIELFMRDEHLKKRYKSEFNNIFKLRNRLAHYKEPRQEVISPNKKTEMNSTAEKVATANKTTINIVSDVINTSISKRRKQIMEVGEWIETAIYDYYKMDNGKPSTIDIFS